MRIFFYFYFNSIFNNVDKILFTRSKFLKTHKVHTYIKLNIFIDILNYIIKQ